jgi:hypothetical protein
LVFDRQLSHQTPSFETAFEGERIQGGRQGDRMRGIEMIAFEFAILNMRARKICWRYTNLE